MAVWTAACFFGGMTRAVYRKMLGVSINILHLRAAFRPHWKSKCRLPFREPAQKSKLPGEPAQAASRKKKEKLLLVITVTISVLTSSLRPSLGFSFALT